MDVEVLILNRHFEDNRIVSNDKSTSGKHP